MTKSASGCQSRTPPHHAWVHNAHAEVTARFQHPRRLPHSVGHALDVHDGVVGDHRVERSIAKRESGRIGSRVQEVGICLSGVLK